MKIQREVNWTCLSNRYVRIFLPLWRQATFPTKSRWLKKVLLPSDETLVHHQGWKAAKTWQVKAQYRDFCVKRWRLLPKSKRSVVLRSPGSAARSFSEDVIHELRNWACTNRDGWGCPLACFLLEQLVTGQFHMAPLHGCAYVILSKEADLADISWFPIQTLILYNFISFSNLGI